MAENLTQPHAQTQTDPSARDIRQQRLFAVERILQEAHVANFETVVDDGILLGRQRQVMCEQSLDYINITSSQPQAAKDRSIHI